MLDRTLAPAIAAPGLLTIPEPQKGQLSNGVPLFLFPEKAQDVFRVEWVFKRTPKITDNPALGSMLAKVLQEGTEKHSAFDFNSLLAQKGAFTDVQGGKDFWVITLYAMPRFASALIPLLEEMILEPILTEEAIEKHVRLSLQQLEVSRKKTAWWAGQLFSNTLYPEHPYGQMADEAAYQAIHQEELKTFHQALLHVAPTAIFVSGHIDASLEKAMMESRFHSLVRQQTESLQAPRPAEVSTIKQDIGAGVQTSIRMGKRIDGPAGDGYPVLYCLNELFGGFFGSRLMQNIREDKGWTYGIRSSLAHMPGGSHLVIGSDIQAGMAEAAFEEIAKEMMRLQNELVSPTELDTVRNFILGDFINEVDTVFALSDKYRGLYLNGLPNDWHKRMGAKIQTLTAEDLMYAAQSWLKPEDMHRVAVV
jgi:zinc protease